MLQKGPTRVLYRVGPTNFMYTIIAKRKKVCYLIKDMHINILFTYIIPILIIQQNYVCVKHFVSTFKE